MKTRTRMLAARVALALGAAVSIAWLAKLDFSRRISLDVVDLIPAGDRAPELDLVRNLAGEQLSRVVLLSLEFPPGTGDSDRARSADAFLESLSASPAIAEVFRIGDSDLRNSFGAYLVEHRFELLLPSWLAERRADYDTRDRADSWPAWLADRIASDLETFLGTAEAMAFEELLPLDPLLLVPSLAAGTPGVAEQALFAGSDGRQLFWALGAGSSFDPRAQTELANAIAAAGAAAESVVHDAKPRWTGVSRFAAHSRERIKSEVARLNILSVVAVFAVGALCLRRARQILHAVPVVLCSLLGAWTVTTMLVPRVHILVLVVGALLCGIAIDYAFHLLLHRSGSGEGFEERLRSVLRPLLVGAFTSVAGFSFLLMSELPFVRHLGIFVTSGLIAALGAAVLWFAQFAGIAGESRGLADASFRRLRNAIRKGDGRLRPAVWIVVAGAFATIAYGSTRLRWHDDIHDLEIAAPELYANDAGLRSAFGETAGRATFFTTGKTVAEARSSQEEFMKWAARARPDAQAASLALALPTRENFDALPNELAVLDGFAPALEEALSKHGFEPGHFGPFFSQFHAFTNRRNLPSHAAVCSAFADALHGPLRMMLNRSEDLAWITTVIDRPIAESPPEETATVGGNQLQTLNRAFRHYRTSASRLALLGVGVAGIAILIVYGPKRSLVVFLLPAFSCAFALGLLGALGQELNLFHLLGVFLGACLSFDYAAFAAEARSRGDGPPKSILFSALTTIASFAVLATSTIPVVAALGITVSLIVLASLLLVEIA